MNDPNDPKEKVKEAIQEHVDALKEREARISLLETRLKCQALEEALRAQNVLSPSLVAMKLAKNVGIDEKGDLQIIDENGLSRRTFRTIQAEDGTPHVENRDMTISELVSEFLNQPEYAHFRGNQAETEKKSRSISEEEYQRLLVDAQRSGRVTDEFLRAHAQKYSQKGS